VQRGAQANKQANIATYPWWLAGGLNTVVDLGAGFWSTPKALGHLGEGSGTFAGDPTLENSAGVFSDISVTASTLIPVAGALERSATATVAAKPEATTFEVGEILPDGRIAGDGPGAALRNGPDFSFRTKEDQRVTS